MSRLEDCCRRCPDCSRVLTCDVESLCRHRNPVCRGCCLDVHREQLLDAEMRERLMGWGA